MGGNNNKLSFSDWIGLRRAPKLSAARRFGPLVGFVLGLAILAIAVGGIATLIQFLSLVLNDGSDHAGIRNLGLAVVAVFGAPLVVWRAAVAQKQADVGEQSHITDQITRAVAGLGSEKTVDRIGRPVNVLCGKSSTTTHWRANPSDFQLKPRSLERERERRDVQYFDDEAGDVDVAEGWDITVESWPDERTDIEWQGKALELEDGDEVSGHLSWAVFSETLPNIEVRLGSIYALERISQDSQRDHIRIMEILTAYIRENSPVGSMVASDEPFFPSAPRTDIQVALDVIGRRSSELVALEHSENYRLDLRKSDLSGANFSKGHFEGALLTGCRLEAANFRYANLKAARLEGSLLNFVKFHEANLCGALIDYAIINRKAQWHLSIAGAKDICGLSMAGADISAINFLPANDAHGRTFGTKDTILSESMEEKREGLAEDVKQFFYFSNGQDIDDEIGVQKRLTEAGFLGWSPFASTDGATGMLRTKVWERLGLKGFPFEDH